jgi:DNA-binding HxlR family transcriptional regulator
MTTAEKEHLLITLKVLADDSRLKLVRLLNEREYNVGELAEAIELTEPTVSHHLSKLHSAGLVQLRMAGNQRFYRLNQSGLDKFKKLANTLEQTPSAAEPVHLDESWIDALGWKAEDAQVLRQHTRNGKLLRIPTKLKQTKIILRWLVTLFEADKLYTEKEVNEVIKSVHKEDFVSLRRELIDFGWLRRSKDGAQYWVPGDKQPTE